MSHWLGLALPERPLVTFYLRSQTLRPLSTVAPSHDEDLLGRIQDDPWVHVTEKCAFKHNILP